MGINQFETRKLKLVEEIEFKKKQIKDAIMYIQDLREQKKDLKRELMELKKQINKKDIKLK